LKEGKPLAARTLLSRAVSADRAGGVALHRGISTTVNRRAQDASPSSSSDSEAKEQKSTLAAAEGQSEAPVASSSSSSQGWKPALAAGVEPAYDAALAFLKQHRESKLEEAKVLREQGEEQEAEAAFIEAYVDDPETRHTYASGRGDLSSPVFRFLREQSWRNAGSLDRLLERIRLMKVIPDVIPTIAPTVDLQVSYGTGAGIGDHGGEGGDIWPGVFIPTAKTIEVPQVTATAFHPDERLYTLLLIDPDVPDELSMSFTSYVHYQLVDIPISATKTEIAPDAANVLHSYIPPHPQKGTPYHRYSTVLLEQTQRGVTPAALPGRHLSPGSIRDYIEQNGLKPVGIHFFRQVYNPENTAAVEQVYRDILKLDPPAYGNMPKHDRYRDSAGLRLSRYFSSSDELAAANSA